MSNFSVDDNNLLQSDTFRPNKRRRLEAAEFHPQRIGADAYLSPPRPASNTPVPSLPYTPRSYATPESNQDEEAVFEQSRQSHFGQHVHTITERHSLEGGFGVYESWKSSHTEDQETENDALHSQEIAIESTALPQLHEAGRASDDRLCFGMITGVELLQDGRQESSSLAMRTHAFLDGHLIRRRSEPQIPFGSIDERHRLILESLADQSEIDLQYLVVRRQQASQASRKTRKRASQMSLNLCVIIYGSVGVYDLVGDFLAKCDLWLQDPIGSDRCVRYRNPQSLWALDDDIVRMTQDLSLAAEQTFESYEDPADLLAELEYEDDLPESQQPHALKTPLFSHQKQALTFMLRREQGWSFHGPQDDLWRVKSCSKNGQVYVNTVTGECQLGPPTAFRGGILGDTMGLGKSLTIISLIASDEAYTSRSLPSHERSCQCTLIVVRAPLLHTWSHQLKTHLHEDMVRWRFHHGGERVTSVQELEDVDIILTTYQTIVSEYRKDESHLFFSVNWHRIVLDEAHDIRDHTRLTAKTIRHLNATSRWAVTGTPIQNNLDDLGSLYQFLRVEPYTDPKRFKEIIGRLCNQQRDDALDCLKRLIRCIMLRRSITSVSLPTRTDLVARLDFSQEEADFYNGAKVRTLQMLDDAIEDPHGAVSPGNVLVWITGLRMICNLGVRAKIPKARHSNDTWNLKAAQELYNSLVTADAAICAACKVDLSSAATQVADEVSGESTLPRLTSCSYLLCGSCFQRGNVQQTIRHGAGHRFLPVSTLSSCLALEHDTIPEQKAIPTKVKALLHDIETHIAQEKFVVFSFWTTTLDVIQECLKDQGIGHMRFDGKVSNRQRGVLLKSFHEDSTIRVALLTISCGAVGLDLTAASRAYLMEPHWNPSVEQQALARVYRMGQKNPVTTVRYVMRDTFEDHVVSVQKWKQLLADMLLDPQNEHVSENSNGKLQQFRSLISK